MMPDSTSNPAAIATSEQPLTERIYAGDSQAEQLLVSQYWKSLFFILNRRAQDPDLAADIAQDALLLVISKARKGEVENPDAISAFIRQIGINLLIAHYRKEQRRKTDTNDDIQVQFPDDAVSVQRKLQGEEAQLLVQQIVNELPTERDKDLLFRFFVYEQDKAVICQELDLTAAHFDRVLHRARSRLKQLIQHKFGHENTGFKQADLLLITGLALSLTSQLSFEENISPNEVRVDLTQRHYITTRVKDDPLKRLDNKQHQMTERHV